jgi:peptidyl-tRNA hydrolase
MENSFLTVIDTIHRVIADTCVTNNTLFKSQELYNTSFVNLQNSFSNFVFGISVVSGILIAITVVLVAFNFSSANKLGDKSKEELEKIKNWGEELKRQVNELEEIKKQSKVLEKKSQDKINEFEEIKKQFEIQKNPFYHFLKEKHLPNSTINIEISIKSGTFKKTETGYECNSDDYGKYDNKIVHFNKNWFEIIVLEYKLKVQYKELDDWTDDGNGKITLYLNMALVLYSRQKLELEDFNKIWYYMITEIAKKQVPPAAPTLPNPSPSPEA